MTVDTGVGLLAPVALREGHVEERPSRRKKGDKGEVRSGDVKGDKGERHYFLTLETVS